MAFLPINKQEMLERGWESCDFVYVIGDAYVDHPSFGHAIISRILESHGYSVGIISQPDWRNPKSIDVFGRPRLGFLVSGGLLLFLAYGYSILSKKTWDIVWYGYTTVFTLFNVVCLFVLSLNVRRTGPLVRAISGNTLGIYLMHIIAQEIVGRWFAGVPAFQTFWASCLYAAVVLVLCLAVCLPLKKIPVLKKLI